MNLFDYQINAVKQLNEIVGNFIEQYEVAKKRNREKTSLVHFTSTTGSGKTLMSFVLMDELSKEFDNVAFIWLAPNKLHEQTLEKFEFYSNAIHSKLKPLDSDNIDSDNIINSNEILCLNWASIDKDTNTLIRKNENGKYMSNIISKTKESGSNIVVFIDESHIGTSNESSKANAFIESINPTVRIEITATPKNLKSEDDQVIIKREDVVESGVIKKEFIFNDFEIDEDAINKKKLTDHAYKRLKNIKKEFLAIGVNYINPLMIIQIENDNQEEFRKTQYEIELYLEEIGVSKNLVAYYLSDNKFQSESLSSNNCPIEIVFTKTAIATGWDCPRASVLLTFRKSNSDDFKTQVLGRINRMPELKHYGIELLDSAYIYSNIEKYVPENLTQKEFNIKTNKTKQLQKIYIKNECINEILLTKYRKQDVIDTFYDSEFDMDDFVQESCIDFWRKVKKPTIFNVTSKIVYNLHLKDPNIEMINIDNADYVLSNKEIQDVFTKKLKSAGFKIVNNGFTTNSLFDINKEITPYETDRLLNFLKQTSNNAIETYLNMYILILQEENFILFSELLEKIINFSLTKRFRSVEKGTIFEDIKYYTKWTPPQYFDCKKHIKDDIYSKNIFKSICIDDYNKVEYAFAYILEKDPNVKYWYKNGDKGEFYFSIPYKKDSIIKNFYPDFIVKYHDNSIGIYDTKSEMTASDGEAKEKAEYLYNYCKIKKLKGGLIKLKELPTNYGKFIINQRETYTNYDPNKTEWEDFSEIFDNSKNSETYKNFKNF